MEPALFLATQTLITTVLRPVQETSKRPKPTAFACKASFHVSLQEQNNVSQEKLGPKAKDAVFIKLQLPGGLVSSVLDVVFTSQLSHNRAEACVTYQCYDKTYNVDARELQLVSNHRPSRSSYKQ